MLHKDHHITKTSSGYLVEGWQVNHKTFRTLGMAKAAIDRKTKTKNPRGKVIPCKGVIVDRLNGLLHILK